MSTEIKVWQIVETELEPLDVSMVQAGRREYDDLEQWIKHNPKILGDDLLIIGEQVSTKSGVIDFLGIDHLGNLNIIELKRDTLPREVLAQAIDYASDVASWDIDKINDICTKFTDTRLEDYLNENFEEIDLDDLIINKSQRLLLVGFSVEEPLQRMVEWLSDNFDVSINALILEYIKTKSGDELIARTMIIPEAIEKTKMSKKQGKISMSDSPGNYGKEELENLLTKYLSENRLTPQRIKDILLPLCLKHTVVTREQIKQKLIDQGDAEGEGKAGIILTTISREIGIESRDYLRQVIQYDRPNPWEKDNYRLVEEYKELVKNILSSMNDIDVIKKNRVEHTD